MAVTNNSLCWFAWGKNAKRETRNHQACPGHAARVEAGSAEAGARGRVEEAGQHRREGADDLQGRRSSARRGIYHCRTALRNTTSTPTIVVIITNKVD